MPCMVTVDLCRRLPFWPKYILGLLAVCVIITEMTNNTLSNNNHIVRCVLQRILGIVLLLLALIPPAVAGLLTRRALSMDLPVLTTLQETLPAPCGMVIASAISAIIVSLPILLLFTAAALHRVDPETVLAARTLGMQNKAIRQRVILPQARPLLIPGVVLSLARAAGEATATAALLADPAYNRGDLMMTLMDAIRSGVYLRIYVWVAAWLLLAGLFLLLLHRCSKHRPRQRGTAGNL